MSNTIFFKVILQRLESDEGHMERMCCYRCEGIDKEFADILVDHIDNIPLRKQLLHRVVENNKAAAMMRLNAINTPVIRSQ